MNYHLPEPALPLPVRTVGGNAAFHNFYNDYSHITDPNLRRRLALSEVDKIPFGWYHVRAITVAGIGFFTDSYDIFAINLITSILGMVYFQGTNNGNLPISVSTALKAATSGGAVIGQIGFGWLADVIGRRKMYGIELAIIIATTLGQALAAPSTAISMTGLLVFWRVVMGIGIGADYPLSAVITSEFAPTRWRGAMMAAVFSMQGAGQVAAALVALVTTVGFKESFINSGGHFSTCNAQCQIAGDQAWRIIVGFGAIPAMLALYYRITIPETPRFTFDIARDIEKADADIKAYVTNQKEGDVDPITQQQTKKDMGIHLSEPPASWSDVISYFSQWKNFKVIFGTATSWFFFDLAFYGLSLNNTQVLAVIGYSPGNTIYESLYHNAVGNLVLVCAGSIPGYWLSVFLVDTIGRKPIQIFGFLLLTIVFSIIGFAYNTLAASKGALLALYILAQLFFNFGPNTTTFIVPGECFPTRYRSTGHGLSAAFGKVGAIVSQVIQQPLLSLGNNSTTCPSSNSTSTSHTGQTSTSNTTSCNMSWLPHTMQIFALFMLCGAIVSFLIPETKGKTLEELAGERATILDTRNGSITIPEGKTWWSRLNPFIGGRAAGFSFNASPNLKFKSPGTGGKRKRIGIMTSPELLANQRHGRGSSEQGSGNGEYSMSVSSMGRVDANDDDYINGVGEGRLPGWGAGWAVQRNPRRDDRIESIQLFDVGKLLK